MDGKVEIHGLKLEHVRIKVNGITPLICHRFSEDVIEDIENKQGKKSPKGREARNPQEEWEVLKMPLRE